MGDFLESPYVTDFDWVSFLTYSNLFRNKNFEEEEAGTMCYEGQFIYVSGLSD